MGKKVKLQDILLCSLYKRGKNTLYITRVKCFINISSTLPKIWVFDPFLSTLQINKKEVEKIGRC